jgi:hypothetical protein
MFAGMPPVIIAFLSAILIWLLVLSFFLYRAITHYNNLSRGVTKQNLSPLLEKLLSEVDLSRKELVEITRRCDKIEYEGLRYVSRLGLLRFNPFNDTGGDQSFILAMLNNRTDGILLSSLHGRTGTRWYVKKIKGGKGVEHELSAEEKSVIKNAKPIG